MRPRPRKKHSSNSKTSEYVYQYLVIILHIHFGLVIHSLLYLSSRADFIRVSTLKWIAQ